MTQKQIAAIDEIDASGETFINSESKTHAWDEYMDVSDDDENFNITAITYYAFGECVDNIVRVAVEIVGTEPVEKLLRDYFNKH